MDYRELGHTGLKVPPLTLGTANFGSKEMQSEPGLAKRLVEICLEAGLNMFDAAALDPQGLSEQLLGEAIQDARGKVLISCTGPIEAGSSPEQLVRAVETSLRRLRTDYIDLFQVHGYDAKTDLEDSLAILNKLVQSGKVRHIGSSNYCGWQLMKAVAISQRNGLVRFTSQQAYYSLIDRNFEWELMPLGQDQNLGTVVWGSLGWGKVENPARRAPARPEEGPHISQELLYRVIDALESVSKQTGKTSTQISLNWLLTRPTVSTLIIGARNEKQLREKIGALGWALDQEHLERLSEASTTPRIYPYWHPAGVEPAPEQSG